METRAKDRADVAEAREQWRAQQAEWRPDNLVFVDETGASTKMTRLYGRCPRGERLVAPVPGAIGRRRPSSARCGRTVSLRLAPSTARSTARSSAPGSSSSSFPELKQRRYRHPRQSAEPQGRGRQDGDRKRQSPSALPAVLQPRSQPDRAMVRQTEGPLAQGRGPNLRHPNRRHRHRPPNLHPRRMRKLSRKLRISTPIMKML